MKAGTEFCCNVLLNYHRTGVTHYGGVTVRTNQYLKNHKPSLKVSMTIQITATYNILPHANLTFIQLYANYFLLQLGQQRLKI